MVMRKQILATRHAAIFLLSAGYGWAGGHYIPANSPLFAYAFQLIVITAILFLGTKSLEPSEKQPPKTHWSVRAISIFSALSLLINVLNILNGAINHDKPHYGSHNSFADLVPITIIISGAILWLSTLRTKKWALNEE
jgi:hypothetical protein